MAMSEIAGADLGPTLGGSYEENSGGDQTPVQGTLAFDLDRVWPHPARLMETGRRFLDDYVTDGTITIALWRGSWVEWVDGRWKTISLQALEGKIWRALEHAIYFEGSYEDPKEKDWNPTKSSVANVVAAISALVELPDELEIGEWVDGDATTNIVSLENGVLDVDTRELLEHTPRLFTFSKLPFAYQPDAQTPSMFLEFLDSVWSDESAAIDLLQEIFGWAVSGRMDFEKIAFLIGPPRAGKGVISNTLIGLIGRDNVAAVTLSSFSEPFGLSDLVGKSLAIIHDARIDGRKSHTVVERLLTISGRGPIPINAKYQPIRTMRLPTRFMIVSNELPKLTDPSGAIASRFVFLKLNRSFLGREDPSLSDRLLQELPAIFNWSLEGLDRLDAKGRFTIPASSAGVAEQMGHLVSPIRAFIDAVCELGEDFVEGKDLLYAKWILFTTRNNLPTTSKEVFFRDLYAAIPSIAPKRGSDEGERRQQVAGIREKPSSTSGSWSRL